MAAQGAPTLFVSYSHRDASVARRLVRRLTAHGIRTWLDERELRLGATLPSSIRRHIQEANTVLVIASGASAASEWVGRELEFAKEQGKAILPIFIEPVSGEERFRDHLGVDATSPQAFEDVVYDIMHDLLLPFSLELSSADPTVLTAGLRAVAAEEPGLAPLITSYLDSQGLSQANMNAAYGSAFHPLDYALNALFDLMPNSNIAQHAAYGFCLAGAGTRALSSWTEVSGDGGLPLVTAVGNSTLKPELIWTAIKLLGACDPPNNHALYQFIHRHSAQLDEEQRRATVRLVTWPLRNDTARLADVLAWVALKHFPEAVGIQQMWSNWVHTGAFDGKPSAPVDLARYLADAEKEGLNGWEIIQKALRNHVRGCLRSGDKNKVVTAMDHVQAAADAGAPVLAALLRETEGVSGSAEWNDWKQRDPESAEWMGWYVFEVAKEANSDRNWLRAWQAAEQMVAFEEKRRQILGESAKSKMNN